MNCCRCLPVVGKGLVGSLATGGGFGVHDGGGEPRHGMDELVFDVAGFQCDVVAVGLVVAVRDQHVSQLCPQPGQLPARCAIRVCLSLAR
jgi:hypothetical protein